jgi:hypothetical protein
MDIPDHLLTRWADSCLHMNHLGTLIERELAPGPQNARAIDLIERARQRAWILFTELRDAGAPMPDWVLKAEQRKTQPTSPPEPQA